MSKINMRSDMIVNLIDTMGNDHSVVRAAQVSVFGENDPTVEPLRFITYLLKNRHGSPFEHLVFTFYVNAPLFVFREFQRHRIASYNEMSGRYTEMKPDFYTPDDTRVLVNSGSSARPSFNNELTTRLQREAVLYEQTKISQLAWNSYQVQLDRGIAKEIARMVLPLNIYSEMYVTMNARALMNFLSLRTISPNSMFPSYPQREIEMVAEPMEEHFKQVAPATYQAFQNAQRVAP